MTPQLLFDSFERLADAPDAIPKLRAMILQLAVQGKLVPQNPDDEPASVLLEKIATEKERLIQEGKLRRTEPLPPLGADEIPYGVPKGWVWSSLSILGLINPRNDASDDTKAAFVPMSLISDKYGIDPTFEIRPWKEIKNGFTHFADGDIAVAKITPCFQNGKSAMFGGLPNGIGAGTTELHVFRPVKNALVPDYVWVYLKSPEFLSLGELKMTGSAGQKRVPKTYFAENPFPLPPISEQQRIVAKVDQLMTLCDELEERKKRRDEARVNLNAACLHELTSPEPQKPRKAWNRIQSHFDLLYDTPANVAALRKSILQLAVMGRLAPHDSSDEPASVLLEKIAAEKERLIKEGKIKNGKPLPPIRPDEVPYEVPKGWAWVRIGDIAVVKGGKRIPKGYTFSAQRTSHIYIRVTDMKNCTILQSDLHYISDEVYDLIKEYTICKEDIYVTIAGTIGAVGIVPKAFDGMNLTENAAKLKVIHVEKYYLVIAISSAVIQDQFKEMTKQLAQPKLALNRISFSLLPLPPLSEQKRIVAKVERLMALCDQLEGQLAQSQRDCNALLSAIVNHIETVTQSSCQE